MTFPAVLSVSEIEITTAAQSYSIAMPATVDAGDLLIMFVAHDADAAVAFDAVSGWTNLFDADADGTGRVGCWAKVAVGNEDGTNVTVSFSGTGNREAEAFVFRIQAGTYGSGVIGDVEVTTAEGTSGTPDPPPLTASWGSADNLWIVFYCADNDRALTAYPANFTSNQVFAQISGVTGDQTIAAATRELVSTEVNPGAFTIAASEQWRAATLGVRGFVDAGGGGGQAARAMHQMRMRRVA
ncbi:MAG TPA: hypothetical protein VJB57_00780 [Dehalococcoidia bacterium]|nr:hypothetical protein [Dehalococcoidia bacterium]